MKGPDPISDKDSVFIQSLAGYARAPGLKRAYWSSGRVLAFWAAFSASGVVMGYGIIRLIGAEMNLLELWLWFSVFFGALLAVLLSMRFKCATCGGKLDQHSYSGSDWVVIACRACKRYDGYEVDTSG